MPASGCGDWPREEGVEEGREVVGLKKEEALWGVQWGFGNWVVSMQRRSEINP